MTDETDLRGAERAADVAAKFRDVIGQLKRRLREQTEPGDLNWSQMTVLSRLERYGPATVTTLARADGVRPQSMGATVTGLESAGLLCGAQDPNDGRQTILSITDAGRALVREARAARQDWLVRTLLAKLDQGELDELDRGLDLIQRLVAP